MVAILGYSRAQIIDAVQAMYTAVALNPLADFHFPVGRAACTALGYPREQLDLLPTTVVDAFAGVGQPLRGQSLATGERVLDIGAGAGVDTLIASHLVGPSGQVVALDLTHAMTRRLHAAARDAGCGNVEVLQGTAEALPLADAAVDVITSNGALNLVPDKRRAVAEMFRVLRPGGRLLIADVVIRRPVTVDCESDPRLWVECVVGATVDDELPAMFRDAGFHDVRVTCELDYFAHSPSAQTRAVAAGFGARSVELAMQRGAEAPARWRQWMSRMDPRRLGRRLWRRGLGGMTSLVLALLACYGSLLVIGLVTLIGLGIELDETLWAGAIMLFAGLAAAGVAVGARRHRHAGPGIVAVAGAMAIGHAMFVDYHPLTELSGFIALGAAAAWDLYRNRREQQRLLGLRESTRADSG